MGSCASLPHPLSSKLHLLPSETLKTAAEWGRLRTRTVLRKLLDKQSSEMLSSASRRSAGSVSWPQSPGSRARRGQAA